MLLDSYRHYVNQGQLSHDEQQLTACRELDLIGQRLQRHQQVDSLYIYGPVGRGKSMLMDLFEQQLQGVGKIRLHYHHFMQRVHQELNQLQGESDPMLQVATAWSEQYQVICLDEFIVEDIGDAMILARLWEALFAAGVCLVTTSNTPPQELYRGGLARHRFEPFIDLLQRQCKLVELDSGIDFRRLGQADTPYYLVNQTCEALQRVTEARYGKLYPAPPLIVMNRVMTAMWHNHKVAFFDFWDLCSGPRSQRDYMQLAERYQALAVASVPAFSYQPSAAPAQGTEDSFQRDNSTALVSRLDNEARRFIALVDECYDRGCHVLIQAEVELDELYQAQQLKFPFQRCISRLIEMQRW